MTIPGTALSDCHMKHVLLPPFFAVAALVSCDPVLAQQIPQPQPSPEGVYLNTERGLRVRPLEGREISPSLIKGLKPEEQITKRTPGVPTKPDPAGLYALMDEIGADRSATLFVGDSDVDILTGHNAGLPALGVLWGFRGEAELTAAGADALAAKPEDILTYLHQH